MTLYESIFERRSVRNFRMDPLNEKSMSGISRYKEELIPLFAEIDTKIEIISNLDNQAGIKGMFTVKAPYYLLFYSEEREGYLQNAGYMAQQMVLYLFSRGIGSCYQGMARLTEGEVDRQGRILTLVIAFGEAKGELRRKPADAKRLDLQELCVFKEEPGRSERELLDAARLAPSAMNGQPWRFVVYGNRIHVFMRKSGHFTYRSRKWERVDMGIVLAHLMIAIDDLWIDAVMSRLENITHKTVPNNEYVISVVLGK
ncbi:nitroreductase family protein [Lachnospiraceae bacterium ASD3451]|uniref:nitroreductase family protein n=1 Tax=Diplocloster agilis TaxID=2850323 RepID=UPI001D98927D|nr:nitroreductase family protein [Diplocloster agilis]MBU9742214.1 nitroreductase family protein [Diplocloster agilis]